MIGHFRNIANKSSMLGARIAWVARNATNGSNQNLKDFTKESLICGAGAYASNRMGLMLAESAFLFVYFSTSITLGYNLIERMHRATERAVGKRLLRGNMHHILLKLTAAQLVSLCLIGGIYKIGDIILPPRETFKTNSNTFENASKPESHPSTKIGLSNRQATPSIR